MALNIQASFPAKSVPPTTAYPHGSVKNETQPNETNDGTPIDAVLMNNILGFFEAVFKAAGITPDGAAESALNSQVLNGLKLLFQDSKTFAGDWLENNIAGTQLVATDKNKFWLYNRVAYQLVDGVSLPITAPNNPASQPQNFKKTEYAPREEIDGAYIHAVGDGVLQGMLQIFNASDAKVRISSNTGTGKSSLIIDSNGTDSSVTRSFVIERSNTNGSVEFYLMNAGKKSAFTINGNGLVDFKVKPRFNSNDLATEDYVDNNFLSRLGGELSGDLSIISGSNTDASLRIFEKANHGFEVNYKGSTANRTHFRTYNNDVTPVDFMTVGCGSKIVKFEGLPKFLDESLATELYVNNSLQGVKHVAFLTGVKDVDLTGITSFVASSYSAQCDKGGGLWAFTGETESGSAAADHVLGSVFCHDSRGNKFKNIEQRPASSGILPSDSTDCTDALNLFFSEADEAARVDFINGVYLLNIGSQEAIITDQTDESMCAIKFEKPVHINGGTFKALSGSGVSGKANYIFSIQSDHVNIKNVHFDGNRLQVNSSRGVQVNNSDCNVSECSFKDLDSSAILVNGLDKNSPLKNIRASDNFAYNCGNTLFVGYCENIQAQNWRVELASEGLDLDKRCTGGNFSGWVISTVRGSGADAALEINGGVGIQADSWVSIDFLHGILVNGKFFNETEFQSQNISAQNHTIINPTGHGIVVGNALDSKEDAMDCVFDGYTIVGSTLAGVAARGANCSFKDGKIRGSNREGILQLSGECYFNGTQVSTASREGVKILKGKFSIDNVVVKHSSQEESQKYNAIQIHDGSIGSANCISVNGTVHSKAIKCLGDVELYSSSQNLSDNDIIDVSSGTKFFSRKGGFEGGLSLRNAAREFQALEEFVPSSSFAAVIGDTIYHTDEDPDYMGKRWNGEKWKKFGLLAD